jgi:ketosteroid isomerase-like protein
MKDCPFDVSIHNVQMLEDGNKVVQTLDCVMTAPIPFRFRMCDILTIEDGKVRSEETFYDTAQFPPEVKALEDKLTREKQSKKAA